MNIGVSPDDVSYVLIGGIAAIFVIPLGIFVIGMAARFVAWIFRIQSGWFYTAWWVLLIGGLVVGGSLYMDVGAERLTGTVTAKTESVKLRREGDWKNQYDAEVEYSYRGKPGHAKLALSEARFDSLREGGSAEIRVASLYETIVMVRLATINTVEWLAVPLRWVAIIALIIFAFLQAEKIKSRFVWITIFVAGLLLAITVPSYLSYRAWQRADNLESRPLRAEATVTVVQRITNIDYFPCESNCGNSADTSFDVPQQYDIVQLTFLPDGRSEEVLAADSADVGSYVTFAGDTVEIAYRADAPRTVQLIGATHSHYWRNAIFYIWTTVAGMILLFVVRFAFHWGLEKFGHWMSSRASTLRRINV